ncbi:hypothetical protein [Erwinia sp. E_sp_W01_6]|uniref:hypothetical protein n=1 Tax=Erwinia sp. E_sp_W01_6 TaxID=3039408 RepID=UPI0030CEFB70
MRFPPVASPLPAAEGHKTTFFTRRILISLSLLLSFVMLMAMLMVIGIAWRQNQDSIRQESFLLHNAWKDSRQSILTDIRDYAFGARPGIVCI